MWIYVVQIIAWVCTGMFTGVALVVQTAEPVIMAVMSAVAGVVARMIEADEVKRHYGK